MPIWLSTLLIKILVAIVSDKAATEVAKRMVVKAVDSTLDGVGITDTDAKDLIHSIADSGLNVLTKELVSKVV